MSDQNFHIKKGEWVEVTSTETGFEGSWFVATVIEPPPKSRTTKGRALVMFEDFIDDSGSQLCEFVDTVYIRPIPPEGLDVGGFEVNDLVEAKYNDGWWVGVVTKLLEASRYEVYFESPREFLQFQQNDLRLHRLWVDGKWIRPAKQVEHNIVYAKDEPVKKQDSGSCEYLTSSSEKNKKLKVSATDPILRRPKKIRFVNKSHPTPSTLTGKALTSEAGDCSAYQKSTTKRIRRRHRQRSKEKGAEWGTVKDKIDTVEIDASEKPIFMEVEAPEGQDTPQEKETQIVGSNNNTLQDDIATAHVCDNIAHDELEQNDPLVNEETCQLNKAGIGGSESDHLLSAYLADNDQQPSFGATKSCLSKEESLVNVKSSRALKEVDETAVRQIGPETEALVTRNTLFDDKLTWPFAKKSPLWKTVENFDVFKVIPQRPHFYPLNETEEVFREGMAIGLMVTFSTTCENICDLMYNHPNEKFEQILESLDDLQTHGFDVVSLRARVNLLVSLKSEYQLLVSQVEAGEKEKNKKLNEKEKYVGELQELVEKRAELEKLIADAISKKEEKDKEVHRLQLYVDDINEKIRKTRYEFNVNVASWKCDNGISLLLEN